MKKYFLFLTLLVFIATACNDNDDKLKLSETRCELDLKKNHAEIQILRGGGEYQAISSNSRVAYAYIEDNTLYIVGYNSGEAIVTVSDANENNVFVNVSVTQSIDYPLYSGDDLYLKLGETRTYEMYPVFSSTYSLSVDNEEIASANYKRGDNWEDLFVVTAKKIGVSVITIKKGVVIVCQYPLHVVDEYDLYIRDNTLEMKLKGATISGVSIYRGSGKYKAEVADETIATVSVNATETHLNFQCNPAVVWVDALKEGNTTITITDMVTGQTSDVDLKILDK